MKIFRALSKLYNYLTREEFPVNFEEPQEFEEIIEEEEICAEQAQLDEQRTGNANDEEDTIAEMGSALVQRNAQYQESSKNKSKTAI